VSTKVEGLCNFNESTNENEWKWESCNDKNIPFHKLWKAVRGGVGGTYVVVTAATYQLHDHLPLNSMTIPPQNLSALMKACSVHEGMWQELKKRISFFFLDYLYNPESLNVDEKASNSCGHPGFNFYDLHNYFPLYCRDAASFINTWKESFVKKSWKQRATGTI